MPYYSSWEELCGAAQKKCRDILDQDVAPVAEEIVKEHIQSDIYDAYEPVPGKWIGGQTYQRRHVLDGSVYHEIISDSEIMVTSKAAPSDPILPKYRFHNDHAGAFLELLETGDMGFWRKNFPRPAIGNAQEEIEQGSRIRDTIRSGLDKHF